LVISDAHRGLKEAIAQVFVGAAWRRCRVHFLRNVGVRAPKTAQPMVGAAVRTIFQQPSRAAARAQLTSVCATLGERFPARRAARTAGASGDPDGHAAGPP
jgi:transposase-like protein